jgi:3-hydroxymyristoyl/3-hydroxydecanoyl-(acyl carrier protein) dehydratase
MEQGKIVTSVTIDGNSPWFSGHFPGDPILPGIAQLKMVADLVVDLNAKSGAGNLRMTSLSRVKFRKIVRPGELLDIQVTHGDKEDQYIFKITSGDEGVCSGWMFFTQTNPQHSENTKTKK